ncbi:retrovirus-related pol polyprotein from transposon TNT 1-94 [Tanacetum coccineum]
MESTVLTTYKTYPSRKIRRIRALNFTQHPRREDLYADAEGLTSTSKVTTRKVGQENGKMPSVVPSVPVPAAREPASADERNRVRLKVKLELDEWIKNSGCSRHMTGNKDLFSTYEAINGGNVVFGSNTKSKIISKESLNVRFDESPPPKSSPLVDDDIIESKIIENQIEEIEGKENRPLNKEIIDIKEFKDHPLEMVIEPKNIKESIKDESCTMAMQEELNQFVTNDVWTLVSPLEDQTLIGKNFDETYAPVARLESIKILLAYACANDFKLFQMDVKSAFLNGFINKKVYVSQPPGFVNFEKLNHVYKSKKALYGLKQAPKAWYDRLKAFLLDHEYTMGLVANTLFTKKRGSHIIIV